MDNDKKRYAQEDVDRWVAKGEHHDASPLLDERLPKCREKLNRLDRLIRKVLSEIQEVFPDAQYYTASGGFNLLLGSPHDNSDPHLRPMPHRLAWGGLASIGDGDF